MEFDHSSFRDPSGSLFSRDGSLYRQVNQCYQAQFDQLTAQGFFEELFAKNLLVRHKRVADVSAISANAYCVIKPEVIPMISYPYEWTFLQLKDAALITLELHLRALKRNFIMKDASAYNIQFHHGQPIMIDTLSFDFYHEGEPWVAYGQFCRHFLAPLLLMVHRDIRLNALMRLYIDGIPLDLAAKLLSGKGGLFAKQHIVWHAKATERHSQDGKSAEARPAAVYRLPKARQILMIESMIRGIEKLAIKNTETEWANYYAHTNYTHQGAQQKAEIVKRYLEKIKPATVWDMGANDGTYSRLAIEQGASVAALDIDPTAVMLNYAYAKKHKLDMLPMLFDFTNPSPAIGFANQERMSLAQRKHPDCILALAVIHHMAISNNLPFWKIAAWLASLTQYLVIEFVPKSDSQTKILLASRQDIFSDYSQDGFEKAFEEYFILTEKQQIDESSRILYLYETLARSERE